MSELSEKVAVALGWHLEPLEKYLKFCREGGTEVWVHPVEGAHCTRCEGECPPRYDEDWSVTGPLIEEYKLALWYVSGFGTPEWRTNSEDKGLQLEGAETGAAPLIAVCHLILALKEAGKL